MLDELENEGPLTFFHKRTYVRLTAKGMWYVEEKKNVVKETQCFVAMWVAPEMREVFEKTISKAIEDSGFKPLIIWKKEHNGDINDHIIA